jgi:hypothetical protein
MIDEKRDDENAPPTTNHLIFKQQTTFPDHINFDLTHITVQTKKKPNAYLLHSTTQHKQIQPNTFITFLTTRWWRSTTTTMILFMW